MVELDTVPDDNSCAMYALLELGRKEEAFQFMDKVIDFDPDDSGSFYDATCLYTRIGDTGKAMEYLEKSLDKGFRRFHHLHHDDDLDSLRELPGFEPLVRKYELKAMEEAGNDISGNTEEVSDDMDKKTEVPFTIDGGCLIVKCTINGLPLSFIFDTGASIVSLSQMEANFMLKNGFLSEKDMKGTGRFIDANGDISEGTIVNLRSVDFGGMNLKNVKASVVRNQKAPLLLGQSVLGRLGKIEIDNPGKKLVITHKPTR